MEFKTEFNIPLKRFMWDFFKLNLYLEKFNYQIAVFVSINNSKERIKGLLLHYLKENHYQTSRKQNLYILVQENFDSEIEYFSLLDFCNDNGYT
jgi:hypothetical protein